MPVNVAIVTAIFILATTALALIVFTASKRRQAKEEELKRAASARGWQFAAETKGGYRVHRWTGTTDGVSWRAESLRYTSNNKQQRRPHISRWHGDWNPGINGPIVCMGVPAGKDIPAMPAAQQDAGVFMKLAQKAVGLALDKALDQYFGEGPGKEVDAGALHRIESRLPGFVVMAAEKEEGARIMSQGLERTLADATSDQTSVFAHDARPWILLRPKGVSLARTESFRDVNDIEKFVRAGIGLTRAFTFGRRSPS